MAASTYDAALARVLVHEGGFSDHPADPGGATMKGVIQRVYDGYRSRNRLPPRSVRRIEERELQAIYRIQYWNAVRADDLPAGLDYAVFDAAVNSGPAQAAKWLQRALGVLPVDGQVGEATLEAARRADAAATVSAFCRRRLAMLKGLNTWPVFGKGWARRVADVEAVALAMAADTPIGTARPADKAMPKPSPAQTRLSRTPEGAGGLLTGTGGLGAVIADQAHVVAPLAEISTLMKWLFVLLTAAGVALTLWGVCRRLREGAPA